MPKNGHPKIFSGFGCTGELVDRLGATWQPIIGRLMQHSPRRGVRWRMDLAGDTWRPGIGWRTKTRSTVALGSASGRVRSRVAGDAAGRTWATLECVPRGALPFAGATYRVDRARATWRRVGGLARIVSCSGHMSSPGSFGSSSQGPCEKIRAPKSPPSARILDPKT